MLKPLLISTILSLTALTASATSFVFGTDGIRVLWESSDKIGFLPSNGLQIRFGINDIAADGHCAKTTGYGWALKTGAPYYTYAPYNKSYSTNENVATQLPVSYTGQHQDGNGSTAHLASYAFLAGNVYATTAMPIATVPLRPMTSVIRITERFTKVATLTKVVLSFETEMIPIEGYMNLVEERFQASELATSITLTTDNFTVGANEDAVLYLTLPPCSLSGNTLTMTFYTADGKSYKKTLKAFDIYSGYTYCIGGSAKATTAKEYTPVTDGTTVNPVVVSSDMPVFQSYVATCIKNISIEHNTTKYDILGRHCRDAKGKIIIKNGKKIINN